jgi:uncharacterized protein (UPF0303 family)
MPDLPVFTLEDLERMPRSEVSSFDTDAAVSLGEIAVEVIRERRLDLAVRIMVSGDVVFVAKLGSTGPSNDPWLRGKALVAEKFGEPSLLVRRRHEAAGTPFEERQDVDHDAMRAHGGSIPIFVAGEVAGSITMSGEPDVVDHDAAAEALRRYLAR